MRSQGVYKVLTNSITGGQRKWNEYVLDHEIDDSHPWKRFNWAKQVHRCTWLTTEIVQEDEPWERRIEAPWQHTEKCVKCLCKLRLWKTRLCTQLIQLPQKAAGSTPLYKAFIRAVAHVQWGKGALLGTSALHTQWGTYPWCPKVLLLSWCCFVFVFSILLFLSLSRKQCTLERDVQKRETFSSGADWCAHLAVVFSAATCPLELGSAALTANWRNEIPTPILTGKWAAHSAVFSWKVVSNLCSA